VLACGRADTAIRMAGDTCLATLALTAAAFLRWFS